MHEEKFSSRMGLILSLLGLAVGTGNIWRFPRIAALNGGGSFIIAYLFALFLWAIPLLIVEFACGKKFRKGVVAVFSDMLGPRYTWMGAFVALCTLAIMFYYSVVTGWCLKYLTLSVSGDLLTQDSMFLWNSFTQHSFEPLFFHVISISLASGILLLGVVKGIERVNLFLIPSLFIILILLVGIALKLPGAFQGLDFLFFIDWGHLLNARTWLEALSQSAWSTGAGWGIVLTYAAYSHQKERPVLNAFTTGFGDTSVALLASMCILPTLFALLPQNEALNITASGNTGLTFISLPNIFHSLEGGRFFAIFFFLSLCFASFTSLIAMLELGVHMLRNFGVSRTYSVMILFVIALIMGIPSAVNINFLNNQDWVWGVGLLISGFFFSVLVHRYGAEKFTQEVFPLAPSVFRSGFLAIIKWAIPLEFLILLTWWGFQSIKENPSDWWLPFESDGLATCLLQWGILVMILVGMSRWMSKKLK